MKNYTKAIAIDCYPKLSVNINNLTSKELEKVLQEAGYLKKIINNRLDSYTAPEGTEGVSTVIVFNQTLTIGSYQNLD